MSDIAIESARATDLSAASFEDLVAEMILRLGDNPEACAKLPNVLHDRWLF